MILDAEYLRQHYDMVRKQTETICAPLRPEDTVPQPVIDVSPPKWHLAHTTWFFEILLLKPYLKGYWLFNSQFPYLFNSYYESLGQRLARDSRGSLNRPTLEEVLEYRRYVDDQMQKLDFANPMVAKLMELGINHEQQHQELLVTDIKYILADNPIMSPYLEKVNQSAPLQPAVPLQFHQVPAGFYSIGHQGEGFCYDNELGVHKVFLYAFNIANRLVSNEEYMEFIQDGGYRKPEFWLMDGWEWRKQQQIEYPLYWLFRDGLWSHYTMTGIRKIAENEPITHLSYYEAAAYARWAGKRLLTEFEWEAANQYFTCPESGNFLESGNYHPQKSEATEPLQDMNGNVWEWTNSAYLPYPFYKQEEGALGEYNGKFMVNQMVLRGGSCATPKSHYRYTYRNFFHPEKRWQFTGIRLGESC